RDFVDSTDTSVAAAREVDRDKRSCRVLPPFLTRDPGPHHLRVRMPPRLPRKRPPIVRARIASSTPIQGPQRRDLKPKGDRRPWVDAPLGTCVRQSYKPTTLPPALHCA